MKLSNKKIKQLLKDQEICVRMVEHILSINDTAINKTMQSMTEVQTMLGQKFAGHPQLTWELTQELIAEHKKLIAIPQESLQNMLRAKQVDFIAYMGIPVPDDEYRISPDGKEYHGYVDGVLSIVGHPLKGKLEPLPSPKPIPDREVEYDDANGLNLLLNSPAKQSALRLMKFNARSPSFMAAVRKLKNAVPTVMIEESATAEILASMSRTGAIEAVINMKDETKQEVYNLIARRLKGMPADTRKRARVKARTLASYRPILDALQGKDPTIYRRDVRPSGVERAKMGVKLAVMGLRSEKNETLKEHINSLRKTLGALDANEIL